MLTKEFNINVLIKYIIYVLGFVIYLYTESNSRIVDRLHSRCLAPRFKFAVGLGSMRIILEYIEIESMSDYIRKQ